MFATCTEAQSESCFVQYNMCCDQNEYDDQHKPVKFKISDIYQKYLFCFPVYDRGGYVVRVLCHVDGSYDDNGCRCSHQVQCSTYQCLVGIEVDSCHTKKQGKQYTHQKACQND